MIRIPHKTYMFSSHSQPESNWTKLNSCLSLKQKANGQMSNNPATFPFAWPLSLLLYFKASKTKLRTGKYYNTSIFWNKQINNGRKVNASAKNDFASYENINGIDILKLGLFCSSILRHLKLNLLKTGNE